jgi:Flp pilus assembly protein TadD
VDINDFLALTGPNAASDTDTAALAASKLEANPDDVPALMVRAALQEKNGESPLADYLRVIEIFPQFTPASIALARLYLDDPLKLGAAEKLANTARERVKDDPEVTSILALVNFRKRQFDYASQLLGELATKRELTATELFALGMSKAATHHREDAREALTQALQIGLKENDAAEARTTLAELVRPDVKE